MASVYNNSVISQAKNVSQRQPTQIAAAFQAWHASLYGHRSEGVNAPRGLQAFIGREAIWAQTVRLGASAPMLFEKPNMAFVNQAQIFVFIFET